MNKRIEELVEESGIALGNNYAEGSRRDLLNKFAQLIVKECANEILKWKSEPFPYDPEFGAKLIKEHFGVES